MVLWAHNTHIQFSQYNQTMWMGAHLRAAYG
jgi:hypothetical protein